MKTLKLKSIFLSFLAILMVSVMMTSCEQEQLIDQTIIEHVDEAALEADIPAFFLPHGYEDKMSDEENDSYINTLSTEDIEKLALHRKVVYYFISLDKIELLMSNASYGDIFDMNTIASYLSVEEARLFESFSLENLISLSRCAGWQTIFNMTVYNPCTVIIYERVSCYFPWGFYEEYRIRSYSC